ncbi:TetR/AcrR family transcriptional regulator [Planktotalea sp.]|uniref:TetR/AcrR family transcriptional regulator n=1 Tax=Planktotalea sp. TaxID=2029877 RepID=UPI00329A4A94
MNTSPARQRGSKELWLDAAYEMLVSGGIEAVKVMALAKKLNLSRTGFYWFFADLSALHAEMIDRWERRNTGHLVQSCQVPADNICQALFNVMDCWLDPKLFDAPLDLAIRNWARVDTNLKDRLDEADRRRLGAISDLFHRHGYSHEQAETRSMTLIYTQIGYISMHVEENRAERLQRVQRYVEVFSGTAPSKADVDRFLARHS